MIRKGRERNRNIKGKTFDELHGKKYADLLRQKQSEKLSKEHLENPDVGWSFQRRQEQSERSRKSYLENPNSKCFFQKGHIQNEVEEYKVITALKEVWSKTEIVEEFINTHKIPHGWDIIFRKYWNSENKAVKTANKTKKILEYLIKQSDYVSATKIFKNIGIDDKTVKIHLERMYKVKMVKYKMRQVESRGRVTRRIAKYWKMIRSNKEGKQ